MVSYLYSQLSKVKDLNTMKPHTLSPETLVLIGFIKKTDDKGVVYFERNNLRIAFLKVEGMDYLLGDPKLHVADLLEEIRKRF
jgi:hypothetical protein